MVRLLEEETNAFGRPQSLCPGKRDPEEKTEKATIRCPNKDTKKKKRISTGRSH